MGAMKMWWELESVQPQCCQDCRGRVIPPNKVVDTESLNDECDTVEHSVCKTNTESGVGSIEVTYESDLCCIDSSGWSTAGTIVLEPPTCSHRMCVIGRPGEWVRIQEVLGGCDCCEYKGSLLAPGAKVVLEDGQLAECCEGSLVISLV